MSETQGISMMCTNTPVGITHALSQMKERMNALCPGGYIIREWDFSDQDYQHKVTIRVRFENKGNRYMPPLPTVQYQYGTPDYEVLKKIVSLPLIPTEAQVKWIDRYNRTTDAEKRKDETLQTGGVDSSVSDDEMGDYTRNGQD